MRASVAGVAAVALTLGVSSCSDSGGPAGPTGGIGPTRLLSGPARVAVVTRNTPLVTSQSASATIGIFGGQISLPGAGLTVVIPAFAVATPTTITVTAVAGSEVAYEFEPHGLQFTAPLVVTQSLAGTSVDRPGYSGRLYAGYFADLSALDQLTGTALIDEILRSSVDRQLGTATFLIGHFSGYLLGTGESGPLDGDGTH